MKPRLLEICCDSIESASAAADGRAGRIELCVDLPVDGLTPPSGLLAEVKALVAIPVFVLVRCRAGDFVFSDAEVDLMCQQIETLRDAGADGIVCGALLGSGEIDVVATRKFVGASGGLPFTFHKGFDACADLEKSMEVLVGLGVDRVLTSGGERFATQAIERLARLAEIGGDTSRVLCGGGVRSNNLRELINIRGVREFHSAARASTTDPVDVVEVSAMATVLAEFQSSV